MKAKVRLTTPYCWHLYTRRAFTAPEGRHDSGCSSARDAPLYEMLLSYDSVDEISPPKIISKEEDCVFLLHIFDLQGPSLHVVRA